MKKLVFLAATVLATYAIAADCPTPKRLTCAELAAKAEQRNCGLVPIEAKCDSCCPEPKPSTPTVHYIETPGTPGPERIVDHFIYEDVPPKGHPLFGGGPLYFHGVGATLVAGYQFPNRLQVLGGPMYVPQNDTPEYKGVAVRGCTRIPYTVPSQDANHPWGAQFLLVYGF